MTGRRRRDEIQHRGRWLSEVSVRRYGKAARTMKEAEKMPPAAHRYADLIWSKLSRFLDGSERAPMPPAELKRKGTEAGGARKRRHGKQSE